MTDESEKSYVLENEYGIDEYSCLLDLLIKFEPKFHTMICK